MVGGVAALVSVGVAIPNRRVTCCQRAAGLGAAAKPRACGLLRRARMSCAMRAAAVAAGVGINVGAAGVGVGVRSTLSLALASCSGSSLSGSSFIEIGL